MPQMAFQADQFGGSQEGRNSERLNSPPLTPAGLRGKVVLVDILTCTCINWLRTLPRGHAFAKAIIEVDGY